MHFSMGTEYAIHGLLYLALKDQGEVVYVRDIARAQNVSETYLAKVFQQLARSGLVVSYRGAKGGFALAQPPERITMRRIIEATEGSSPLFNCLQSRRDCKLGDDCEIRKVMNRVEKMMLEILDKTSLVDILDSFRGHEEEVGWLTQLLTERNERVASPQK